MRTTPTWLRWLTVLLVLLTSVIGSFAASSCHCGHEDVAVDTADPCNDDCADTCAGVCACHLTIVPWHPPALPGASTQPLHVLAQGPAGAGESFARLIYSPPRA